MESHNNSYQERAGEAGILSRLTAHVRDCKSQRAFVPSHGGSPSPTMSTQMSTGYALPTRCLDGWRYPRYSWFERGGDRT